MVGVRPDFALSSPTRMVDCRSLKLTVLCINLSVSHQLYGAVAGNLNEWYQLAYRPLLSLKLSPADRLKSSGTQLLATTSS